MRRSTEALLRCKVVLLTILIGSCPAIAQERSSPLAEAERTDLPDIGCAWYDRETALDGILEKQTALPFENEPVSYYLLEPQALLCVNGNPASVAEPGLDGVSAVQIAASPEDFELLSTLNGSLVTVRGRLFGLATAHHFQPLLIAPETIAPQSAATIAFREFWSDFRNAAIQQDCAAMVDLAAIPLQSMGSLDSDPVHQLDRKALAEHCPIWVQGNAILTAGALPPTNWRSAPQADEHARFDAFEFEYEQAEWRWRGFYRQNHSDVPLN